MVFTDTFGSFRSANLSHHPHHWVIKLIHYPFLQRNNRVVRDMDVLGADLRTALCNVAIPDAQFILQQLCTRNPAHGMHFQPSDANKEPWPAELFLLVMVPQHMA